MGLDQMLIMAGVLGGRLVYKGFEHFTTDARETQLALLRDLMEKNANTEYGKKYGFADIKTPEQYRERVPFASYDDYEPYIKRMIAGEQNLLTADKINRYVTTSGSSSAPKLIPISGKTMWNMHCMGFIAPEACIDRYYKSKGKKANHHKGLLTWTIRDERLPNGERLSVGTSVPITNMRAVLNLYSVVPKDLVFTDEADKLDVNYIVLRCGLMYRPLSFIGCAIITSMYTMFRYLEKNWEVLCDDIERGVISEGVAVTPKARQAMKKQLRPDPKRAAELRAEFRKGFDTPIATRIWPDLSWVYGMSGSTLSVYVQKVRRYIGDLPIHTFGYGASEGYFAMPVSPDAEDAVLLPRSNFFEFIPRDPAEGTEPKLLTELQVGKEYEVILTNLSGFYRYRMEDVILVTGYYNDAPRVKFLYRSNISINICDEKSTQKILDLAVEDTTAALGLPYQSFCVYGDTETEAAHYTLLLETDAPVDEALRAKTAAAFDDAMSRINSLYAHFRNGGSLAPADAHFLEPGAFEAYKAMLRAKGREVEQIKPVTIINSPEKKDFFFGKIVL